MTMALFEPYTLSGLVLQNRIVMAPMTRCRATPDHIPTDLMATYYAQRATAGLIVTEGVAPSPNGVGYARIPGLYASEHIAPWRRVTDAVHKQGGKIFVQIMHTGRASQPLNMPDGSRVLSASPIGMDGTIWTDTQGLQPYPVPTEMTGHDITATIEEYVHCAALAIEAGFDGVELHGANGYLIDQFLNSASNRRNDRWGGSVENRARFALDVAKAVSNRIGSNRTGIRLSPYGVFNSMVADDQTDALYNYLARELSNLGLAYIHMVDHSSMGAPIVSPELKLQMRRHFNGTFILSGGYDAQRAIADLAADKGDLIAFGKPFIANPDLVHRMKHNLPLSTPDTATFYTPGEAGYTDYPPAQ